MTVAVGGAMPRLYATDTPTLKLTVLGAEKVLGSAFNDVMNGSLRADTLAGGAGDDQLIGSGGDDYLFTGTSGASGDRLDGGDGKDWLIAEAGASAVLTGAGGDDTFSVTRSDAARTVTINAPEVADRLVWNGHLLNQGSLHQIEFESVEGNAHLYRSVYGYLGDHGEVYQLTALDPAQVGDLIITFADASRIVVHDWRQGELGITLSGGVMPAFGVIPDDWRGKYPYPPTNQRLDGSFFADDWNTIDGAAAALATPGSVAAPAPPTAFSSPPASVSLPLDHAHVPWREVLAHTPDYLVQIA